jgi:hypothetical protein
MVRARKPAQQKKRTPTSSSKKASASRRGPVTSTSPRSKKPAKKPVKKQVKKKPLSNAEIYKRRIQRGLDRGLTRSQARGHPSQKKGEISAAFLNDIRKAIKLQKRQPFRRKQSKKLDELGRKIEGDAREQAKAVADFFHFNYGMSRHEVYSLKVSP